MPAVKSMVQHGTLVSATSMATTDILLEDGKITAIGSFSRQENSDFFIFDATKLLVLPGGIDPHVHLSLPTPAGKSCDDFVSGSKAALAGGTTTLFDFVTPRRGQSLPEALYERRQEAADSLIECHLHLGISEWNKRVATEMVQCIEKEGIRSVKAYLAYRETIGIDYPELRELMHLAGSAGALVMVHCEDGEMVSRRQTKLLATGKTRPAYHPISRPPEAELKAIEKVIELAAATGCSAYIVHISTRKGAEAVAAAKKSGIRVFGETCMHYLLLDESVYSLNLNDYAVLPYILSPPLRSLSDQEGLWEALANGAIDVVATDHCPFNLYGQKEVGIADFTRIPNGAGGIEHRLQLLYTYGVLAGRITLNRFVELTSTRPAEIFGLGHLKGKLEPGYDADLVILDPQQTSVVSAATHVSRCDSEIYEGMGLTGKIVATISNGEIAGRIS